MSGQIARRLTRGLLLAGLLTWSPAQGRVVEYLTDEAQIEAAALDQGIDGPFGVPLEPEEVHAIRFETPEAADHTVKIVSVFCQAFKIENPVATLSGQLMNASAATEKSSIAAPVMTIRLTRGSTLLRCLTKGEVEGRCINTVRLDAELSFTASDGSSQQRPLSVSVERKGRVGVFCGNIARYTGIVTREAALALTRKALEARQGG